MVDLRLERPPALWHQYLRGALLGAWRFPRGHFRQRILAASARVAHVSVDPGHLHAYRRLCGLADAPHLPVCYPHVLATPVAAAMLVRSTFPYPLLGVVHVRQRIIQYRRITAGEELAIHTWFDGEREVARGVEFDTHTEICCADEPVWKGVSTAIVLDPAKARSKTRAHPSEQRGLESTRFAVPADMGRRYARLTQDYNPIHLWPATARPFGFARPIVHGMWSLARGLAAAQHALPAGVLDIHCQFRKPIMPPCEVRLFRYEDESGWGFSLRDATGAKKHLECGVVPAVDYDEATG